MTNGPWSFAEEYQYRKTTMAGETARTAVRRNKS